MDRRKVLAAERLAVRGSEVDALFPVGGGAVGARLHWYDVRAERTDRRKPGAQARRSLYPPKRNCPGPATSSVSGVSSTYRRIEPWPRRRLRVRNTASRRVSGHPAQLTDRCRVRRTSPYGLGEALRCASWASLRMVDHGKISGREREGLLVLGQGVRRASGSGLPTARRSRCSRCIQALEGYRK